MNIRVDWTGYTCKDCGQKLDHFGICPNAISTSRQSAPVHCGIPQLQPAAQNKAA